ncbi:MAG: PilZ domain-containing protein [Oligoflexales bacterium]
MQSQANLDKPVRMGDVFLNDFGFGTLSRENGESISYQPYEISATAIGVLSQQLLPLGSRVKLVTPLGALQMMVQSQKSSDLSNLSRYYLISMDPDFNLEKVFALSGCHKRLALSQSRIQSVRYEIRPALIVKAKTFGTNDFYKFLTVNVSKTGILLQSTNFKAPFILNTIVEVVVESGLESLSKPVRCLGKIVRITEGATSADPNEFGVKLFDFSDEDFRIWKKSLNKYEKTTLAA